MEPVTVVEPEVFFVSSRMACRRVDLPELVGPVIVNKSPDPIVKLIPLSVTSSSFKGLKTTSFLPGLIPQE